MTIDEMIVGTTVFLSYRRHCVSSNEMSQFIASPKASNSSSTLAGSNPAASGALAVAIPFILYKTVPP